MKCQRIDERSYLFVELESGERRRVEMNMYRRARLCGKKLNRLQLTQASLLMGERKNWPAAGRFCFGRCV